MQAPVRTFEEGTEAIKQGVYALSAQMTALRQYDRENESLDEVAGWYEELIGRVCECVAEREALVLTYG